MNTNPKASRGGSRKGAGRKRKEYDEQTVELLVKEFDRQGKQSGSNAARELAFLAYRSENESIRLKALKCYFEILVAKRKEVNIATEFDKPQVYLPEVMPKPPEADERERRAREAMNSIN